MGERLREIRERMGGFWGEWYGMAGLGPRMGLAGLFVRGIACMQSVSGAQ